MNFRMLFVAASLVGATVLPACAQQPQPNPQAGTMTGMHHAPGTQHNMQGMQHTPGMQHNMSGMQNNPAMQQHMAHMQNMGPAHQEFMASMHRMHEAMMQGMMDPDPARSWLKQMAAHHEGAIDMSRIILKHTRDPEIRKEAQKTANQNEKDLKQLQATLRKKS